MMTRTPVTPGRLSHALAAMTLLFASIKIGSGKFVTMVAGGLRRILRIHGIATQEVFATRDRLKVRRPNTATSSTQMVGLKFWWKGDSVFHLIREAGCSDGFVMSQGELPVSLQINFPSPQPAVSQLWPVWRNRTVLVDVTPEARRDRPLSHCLPIALTGTEFLFRLRVWLKDFVAVQAVGIHARSVSQEVH